jgi:betaine-aldehyde dehydrogenase
MEVRSPATGDSLGSVALAQPEDVDAAVVVALQGFATWRRVPPVQREAALRRAAAVLREHKQNLAIVDAIDGGNPVKELLKDVDAAAWTMDYFAGQIHALRGEVLPMPDGQLNYTLRQPLGIIARISAFNHPMMFAAMKIAAPLAAGNAVIVKSPEQAPLSTLRLAEILGSGLIDRKRRARPTLAS